MKIIAKKSLGQHFLTNPHIAGRIAESCEISPSDHVIEIGPGKGALTVHLRAKTDRLYLIEKDDALGALLPEKFSLPTEQVWIGDALEYSVDTTRAWIVVGNLPYNVSLPILFHFLEFGSSVTRMVAMLQKEVALRLAAGPGSKAYGIPSVLLQAQAQVKLLFHVGPGNFFPPPKVESSVVKITPMPSPFKTKDDEERFAALVKAAFSARRKIIANTLSAYRDYFAAVGLSGKERAEDISVAQYLALATLIKN